MSPPNSTDERKERSTNITWGGSRLSSLQKEPRGPEDECGLIRLLPGTSHPDTSVHYVLYTGEVGGGGL